MKIIYKFRYRSTAHMDLLCHISKKLYNQANYYIRQEFFNLESWLRYSNLNYILKPFDNYRLLKSQTSQQILRVLDKNWKSYFKSLKEWKKNPRKFNGRPSLPKYKKEEYFILIFTNQNSKIVKNKIVLTKSHLFKTYFPQFKNPIEIRIPKYKNKKFERFNQIRIIPRKKFYEIEILYNQPIRNSKLDKEMYLSIDLGLNNLATCVENRNRKPIIISGKVLMAINHHWNKQRSKLYSIKDKQGIRWTSQLSCIDLKRNSIVKDYLH